MRENCVRTGAVIKGDIELSEQRGSYIGVEFRKTREELLWRHLDSNVERWREELRCPIRTIRDVMKRLGIVVWDTVVADVSFGGRPEMLELMRKVGGMEPNQLVNGIVTKEEINQLEKELEGIWRNPWNKGRPKVERAWRAGACDASDQKGAWLLFGSEGSIVRSECWEWTEEWRRRPIAERELKAAIELVKAWEGLDERQTDLFIAEDNTTAAAAVRLLRFHVEDLNEELIAWEGRAARANQEVVVVRVPSRCQAADEATRGREPNEQRVRACWSLIEEAAKLERGLTKRVRT
jgi:hypothetical protein